jgi:putative membrane protein
MVPFGNFGWNFGIGFGWIVIVVSFILIVFAIVHLVRIGSGGAGGQDSTCDTRLDVLKKKYARGEITKEEFEAKRKDL